MQNKMLILPGNAELGGKTFPDEQGKTIKWPHGALHWGAAREYAGLKSYQTVELKNSGSPQGVKFAQGKEALDAFLGDEDVTAFYGFSGGGYNLRQILEYLATNKPKTILHIDLVVVLGAPLQHRAAYDWPKYNTLAKASGKIDPKTWKDKIWEVVHRTNPTMSALSKYLPKALLENMLANLTKDFTKGNIKHMFGPEVLLAETKDKDRKVHDDWEDLDDDDWKEK